MLVAYPGLGVNSARDLIAMAKSKTLRSTTSLVLGYGSEAKSIPAAHVAALLG